MPAVKKSPSSVGQAIAAGRARIAELVNNASVGVGADKLRSEGYIVAERMLLDARFPAEVA